MPFLINNYENTMILNVAKLYWVCMFECSVIPSKEVTLTSVCLGSGISAKVYSGRYSGMDVAVEIFNEQADLDDYVDD